MIDRNKCTKPIAAEYNYKILLRGKILFELLLGT